MSQPGQVNKIHDYRLDYATENNFPSWCRVRIYEIDDSNTGPKPNPQEDRQENPATYVIYSEPNEDSGNSVTNAAEYIAAEVMDRHSFTNMIWIEHYERRRTREDDYSLVTFVLDEPSDRLSSGRWLRTLGEPDWKYLSPEQVENLLGDQAPHLMDR